MELSKLSSPVSRASSRCMSGMMVPAPWRKEGNWDERRLERKPHWVATAAAAQGATCCGDSVGCRLQVAGKRLAFCLASLLNKPYRNFSARQNSSWHVETREQRIKDQLSHDCCAWAVLSRLQLFFTGYS